MWYKTITKHKASEAASCLLDFTGEKKDWCMKIILWQSEHKMGFCFAHHVYASQCYQIAITHKFSNKDCTQNEGDCMALTLKEKGNRNFHTSTVVKLFKSASHWAAVYSERNFRNFYR
jgi:hypothetical protein